MFILILSCCISSDISITKWPHTFLLNGMIPVSGSVSLLSLLLIAIVWSQLPHILKMPGRTLSHQKKMKICDAMKEQLAKAVEAYHGELLKKPTMQNGLRTIAELHRVNHNTLACEASTKLMLWSRSLLWLKNVFLWILFSSLWTTDFR